MVLILALLLCAAAPARSAVLAAFTVLGPDGAVARAVVDDRACPAVAIDGKAAAMLVRAAADARFPLVCDAPVPAGAARASIGALALPLLRREVRRIAAFGDTGCRVDARSGEVQACADAAAWPFARTTTLAAALAPDLVLHVGDYLYRESPCPKDYSGCAGTPSGDNWPTWRADFFTPAAPLLKAAPWIMTRGNHENCDRAGQGFFRLLDPRPLPAACPKTSDTYSVKAGAVTLYILDSGEAADVTATAALVERYRQEFAQLDGAPEGAWLVTHRPLWAPVSVTDALGLAAIVNDNVTLQAASGNRLPAGVALVVSGHIHLFEALAFADRRPPQLVLGTGGSSLSDPVNSNLAGHAIAGTTIAYARTAHIFGPTLLEAANGHWTAVLHDEAGKTLFTCALEKDGLSCVP